MTLPLMLLAAALVVTDAGPVARVAVRQHYPLWFSKLHRIVPIVVGVAFLVFIVVGRVSVVLSAVIASATTVQLIDASRTKRRTIINERVAEEVLSHVVADVRAGVMLGEAFARAAEELPAEATKSVRDQLGAVSAHLGRGGAGYTALRESPELTTVARLWELSVRHGLPAAPLLDHARSRLAGRRRHRNRTSASLQGPQATAVILSVLPCVGIALGSGMGADPLGFLLGPGWGGVFLVVGVAMLSGGLLLSQLIITRAAT